MKDKSEIEAKVHTREFPVCCEICKNKTETYVKRDKKLKTVLYVIIFFVALGIIGSTFAGGSTTTARVCQIIAGVSLVLLPYPFVSFEIFSHVSLKTAVIVCRIFGFICIVLGVALLIR